MFERCGARAGWAAVGIDVQCGGGFYVERGKVDWVNGDARVCFGEVGNCRIAVDADGWAILGESLKVAADAAAEVGHRMAVEAGGFVAGDPFVGRLLEADAGEEHLVRLGKLGGRAAAEVGLVDQQVGAGCAEMLSQAGDGGVERRVVAGKVGEHRCRFGAREPFVVSKVATRCHLRAAAKGATLARRR